MSDQTEAKMEKPAFMGEAHLHGIGHGGFDCQRSVPFADEPHL